MAEWTIFIPFKPVPASRPSSGHGFTETYDKYRSMVQAYFESDEHVFDGFDEVAGSKYGIVMEAQFYFPKPKTSRNYAMTKAPDLDNLVKGALDVIYNGRKLYAPNEQLFEYDKDKERYKYPNDSRVMGLNNVFKRYSDKKVGTYVTLKGVDD